MKTLRTNADPRSVPAPIERLKLAVRGAVQGVGFRPFIHRLATQLSLTGWVNNSPQGVAVEVEGSRVALDKFVFRLHSERPPHSFIQGLETSWLDAVGYQDFKIRESDTGGSRTALVLPDMATCPECLREIRDSTNRRYRYPFTNCTNCGPRFSIVESLPYDRANTSMKAFKMCPRCRAEYQDPHSRRFHAQPNACPVCGPQLEIWDADGAVLSQRDEALLAAVDAIRKGRIVAVKGLGGFHLMVAAHDEAAVRTLRDRKHREEKPLALMFPTLESVEAVCEVSPMEARLLGSAEAPIVLLRRLPLARITSRAAVIAASVTFNNPNLGVLLPFTPLHHLLMAELGFPVVATSGNLSDEPICTDEQEALQRLRGIADVFLVHDRPIVRHVDDSIVRVMLDREMVLRRARGYAPLPITLNDQASSLPSEPILAAGAHLKNAIALGLDNQVFISQHIGDLETGQAHAAFHRAIVDFEKLYEARPEIVATDLHPDYLSTKLATEPGGARRRGVAATARYIGVQHHIAHVLSCMGENEVQSPALGVSWDGTGHGLDGTVWGGEFFWVTEDRIERAAHLRTFRLPGGDKAVKEPRRVALGLLYELLGDEVFKRNDLASVAAFPPRELRVVRTMFERRLNTPVTSSAGRLFDAVASLVNLRQEIRFEGQAAMDLEFALENVRTDEAYSLPAGSGACAGGSRPCWLDWFPMFREIIADIGCGLSVGQISAKFHNGLVEGIVAIARRAGEERVVLSGGCFQNRYLTERAVRRLREEGFRPYWHQRVPPNDGGIALGQVLAARRWKEMK